MITLVTGASGSGKSEYGESLVLRRNHSLRYYVATMEVLGAEGLDKVKRHRELRKGKGFVTLERPRDLGSLKLYNSGLKDGRSVLLECVSNLAANEMFCKEYPGRNGSIEDLALRLSQDIALISRQAEDMVVITNEVGSDGRFYEQETMEYIQLMGLLNRCLADMADQVVEVVYGLPVVWKAPGLSLGKEYWRK